jgi:hypothetical protein
VLCKPEITGPSGRAFRLAVLKKKELNARSSTFVFGRSTPVAAKAVRLEPRKRHGKNEKS